MSRLNPIEKESQSVLLMLNEYLTQTPKHPIGAQEFMGIMEKLRMAVKHLANKEYGCWSGQHAGPCHCKWGIL